MVISWAGLGGGVTAVTAVTAVTDVTAVIDVTYVGGNQSVRN